MSPLLQIAAKGPLETLPNIGTGSHVPRFLRTGNKVRNRNFNKTQVCNGELPAPLVESYTMP